MSKGKKGNRLKKFYGDIAGEKYLREIKRFGLRYDEMVHTIVEALKTNSPRKILDIGCGVGNIEESIFRVLPKVQITCVELSPEMISASEKRLAKYLKNSQLSIICSNALTFNPTTKYDAIFSNLVIHNMADKDKLNLLTKVKKWLKPNGIFIWGEFMDLGDKQVRNYATNYRQKAIFASGVSKQFAKEVFAKEEKDFRLTTVETIDLLREAKFSKSDVLWAYNFLAVFHARR